MVPEMLSMLSACGMMTRSTSTGSPTSGRPESSYFTWSIVAPLFPVVAALTRYGDKLSAGLGAFFTGAAALAWVGVVSLFEPQPAAARVRPRTNGRRKFGLRYRMVAA